MCPRTVYCWRYCRCWSKDGCDTRKNLLPTYRRVSTIRRRSSGTDRGVEGTHRAAPYSRGARSTLRGGTSRRSPSHPFYLGKTHWAIALGVETTGRRLRSLPSHPFSRLSRQLFQHGTMTASPELSEKVHKARRRKNVDNNDIRLCSHNNVTQMRRMFGCGQRPPWESVKGSTSREKEYHAKYKHS